MFLTSLRSRHLVRDGVTHLTYSPMRAAKQLTWGMLIVKSAVKRCVSACCHAGVLRVAKGKTIW